MNCLNFGSKSVPRLLQQGTTKPGPQRRFSSIAGLAGFAGWMCGSNTAGLTALNAKGFGSRRGIYRLWGVVWVSVVDLGDRFEWSIWVIDFRWSISSDWCSGIDLLRSLIWIRLLRVSVSLVPPNIFCLVGATHEAMTIYGASGKNIKRDDLLNSTPLREKLMYLEHTVENLCKNDYTAHLSQSGSTVKKKETWQSTHSMNILY